MHVYFMTSLLLIRFYRIYKQKSQNKIEYFLEKVTPASNFRDEFVATD